MGRAIVTDAWKAEAEKRRRKRRSMDLTILEVAERIGVSEATLHRYERGFYRPAKKEVVAAWALALAKDNGK